MGVKSDCQERRGFPRTVVKMPVHFEVTDNGHPDTGLIINASETGILIQTFLDMEVGTRIFVKVWPPKVAGLPGFNIRSEAEVIWKDICPWDDWEAYQYGLKFIQLPRNECVKLRCLLENVSIRAGEW